MNLWLPKNQSNEPKLFFLKGKALPLLSAISKKPLLKKKEIKGWKMCTKALKKYLNDPLYKNSFFIMLTSISSAGFGFLFWMLANFSSTKKPFKNEEHLETPCLKNSPLM